MDCFVGYAPRNDGVYPSLRAKRSNPESAVVLRTLALCSLFHIRDSSRHAELLAAHFGEHGDAFADLLVRWTGKAQPQPAAGIGLVGRPFRPRVDGDAGGES